MNPRSRSPLPHNSLWAPSNHGVATTRRNVEQYQHSIDQNKRKVSPYPAHQQDKNSLDADNRYSYPSHYQSLPIAVPQEHTDGSQSWFQSTYRAVVSFTEKTMTPTPANVSFSSPPTEKRNVSVDRVHSGESSHDGSSAHPSYETSVVGDVVVVQPSFDDHDARKSPSSPSPVKGSNQEWQSRSPQQDQKDSTKDESTQRSPSSPRGSDNSTTERRHVRNLSAHFYDAAKLDDIPEVGKDDYMNDYGDDMIDQNPLSGRKHRRLFSDDLSIAHRRLDSFGTIASIDRQIQKHQRVDSAGLDILSAVADATKDDLAAAAGHDLPVKPLQNPIHRPHWESSIPPMHHHYRYPPPIHPLSGSSYVLAGQENPHMHPPHRRTAGNRGPPVLPTLGAGGHHSYDPRLPVAHHHQYAPHPPPSHLHASHPPPSHLHAPHPPPSYPHAPHPPPSHPHAPHPPPSYPHAPHQPPSHPSYSYVYYQHQPSHHPPSHHPPPLHPTYYTATLPPKVHLHTASQYPQLHQYEPVDLKQAPTHASDDGKPDEPVSSLKSRNEEEPLETSVEPKPTIELTTRTGAASSNQGSQTFVTAIAIGDGTKKLQAAANLKNAATNTDDDYNGILQVPSQIGGRHRRGMSSFSSIGFGTIFGNGVLSPGAPDTPPTYVSHHPLKSSRAKGADERQHHRSTSSVSFLNSFLGNDNDAFLRNLQESIPEYRSPVASVKSEPRPPSPLIETSESKDAQAEGTDSDGGDGKLAPGGTSKRVRRKCTVSGCINRVVQGGLCIQHGAKRKLCSFPGCPKSVKKAGLCSTHGPARKRCSTPGCEKVSVQGGHCIQHGAKKKLCSYGNCTKQAILKGMCKKHHDLVQGKASRKDGAEPDDQPEKDELYCRDVAGDESQSAVSPLSSKRKSTAKPAHTRGLSIFHDISADTVSSLLNEVDEAERQDSGNRLDV